MGTIDVDSIELYYEEHGSGDPLLLIMGLAADSQAWMFQTPEFARQFRTIVFDNRGVGRSSKPAGPYTVAGMADDAAGLLDALGVERAHVVGVSMGGMIAQELALRRPELVRGLVLACTYAKPSEEVEATRAAAVSELGGSMAEDGTIRIDASSVDPLTFFQQLIPRVFNPSFIETQLATLMQLFAGALQWGFSLDAVVAQVGATMSHDTVGRLHAIRSPTLVITGDRDLLVPPHCSDVLAREIPNARLERIAGGSHGFNFETPELFNQHVLDFLQTVEA